MQLEPHRIRINEVVKLSIRGPEQLFGRFVPERECYPPSEEWGRSGFTFYDLAAARKRFEQLTRQNACKTTLSQNIAYLRKDR